MTTSTRFRSFTTATVATTLVLIAVGGAVRATDSGLACPTWPGCFSGGDFVPAWDPHVWLEHSHRLLAGIVGLEVVALLAWSARSYRSLMLPAAVATLAVGVQAWLGRLVVEGLLAANLVTAHLGLGSMVLASLVVIAVRARSPLRWPPAGPRRRLTLLSAAVAATTLGTMLLGAHLTGTGGGLQFAGQPLWGLVALGPLESGGDVLNVAHRLGAVVVLALVMLLAARARRDAPDRWTRALPRVAAWLVTVQVGLGIANLAWDLSPWSVVPHLAVASWLWTAAVLEVALLSRASGSQGAPDAAAETAVGAAA